MTIMEILFASSNGCNGLGSALRTLFVSVVGQLSTTGVVHDALELVARWVLL